jgi:hypothetical protein
MHGNTDIAAAAAAAAGDVRIHPGHPLALSSSNRLLAALLGAGRDPQQGAAVFAGRLAAIGACSDCSRTALPVALKVRCCCCCVLEVVSFTAVMHAVVGCS